MGQLEMEEIRNYSYLVGSNKLRPFWIQYGKIIFEGPGKPWGKYEMDIWVKFCSLKNNQDFFQSSDEELKMAIIKAFNKFPPGPLPGSIVL